MDEQRLAEIEGYARAMCHGKPSVLAEDMVPELIAEVRRQRQAELIAEVRRLRAENHELSALVEALDYQVQTR